MLVLFLFSSPICGGTPTFIIEPNKKPPQYHTGVGYASHGTTQNGIRHLRGKLRSLTYLRYAALWVTGAHPVGAYWMSRQVSPMPVFRSVRPRKSIHGGDFSAIAPPAALCASLPVRYFSFSTVYRDIIHPLSRFVNPKNQFFHKNT